MSTPQWRHHRAEVNGLDLHWVDQGEGPAILLCHGYPHTWFSWRHQIAPLAEAGFRVIAPDMRGMGRTSGPQEASEYRGDRIVGDLVALLDRLGVDRVICSGLDFGMFACYDLAQLLPDRVAGIIALQNPFKLLGDRPPMEIEAERRPDHFNHMVYVLEPRAEVDADARPRELLTGIFHVLSQHGDFSHIWNAAPDEHYIEAIGPVPELPWPWLSEWELETYVADYSAAGFHTALNWYRAIDDNWEWRKQFAGRRIGVPYFLIGADVDIDLAAFHGEDPLNRLGEFYSDVRAVEMLPIGGHLLNMEFPDQVNELMIRFAGEIAGR